MKRIRDTNAESRVTGAGMENAGRACGCDDCRTSTIAEPTDGRSGTGINRDRHMRRGRGLEYFTLGWNLLESLVALGSGWAAGSIALIGFGVDSLIECLSGAVLLWRLAHHAHDESRERMAQKLVALSFFLLSAYVGFEAGKSLLDREVPASSLSGILLAVASLAVMPLLARAKRRVAAQLNSRALVADSRQTDLCAYLSAILLGGLALNALWGWWWSDPVAALIMTPIIAREGIKAWRGEACLDCG
jgi:divalent metal cation (Fe/Co/Zn/Cd) transporter